MFKYYKGQEIGLGIGELDIIVASSPHAGKSFIHELFEQKEKEVKERLERSIDELEKI